MLARSLPFMAKRRVVVVREPGFFAAGARKKGLITVEEEQALLDFCAAPNPDSLLIFRYTTEDAPAAFLKKLIAACDATQCQQPKGRDVAPWLRAEAKKIGKSFTPQALAMLEELAPQDGTLLLASELEKLRLYLADRDDALITEEDVAAIVTPSPTHTIFNLTDAVVEGRTAAALAAYRDCLYLGSKSPQVLRQLEDTVRRLLEVQAMLAEGMSQSAIRARSSATNFTSKNSLPRRDDFPAMPLRIFIATSSTATSKASAQRGWIWTLSSKKSSSTAAPPSLCAADARQDKRSFAHSQCCGRLLYRKECFLL